MNLFKYRFSLDNLFYYSLFGVCATLPFNVIALNSIGIILMVAFWIMKGEWFKRLKLIQQNRILLSCIIFFLLHILFLVNTQNLNNGFFEIEKKLSLFILPLILFTFGSAEKEKIESAIIIFAASCLAMVTYSYFQILQYHFSGGTPFFTNEKNYDIREYFVQIAERHPTYISMYLLFSTICIWSFNKHRSLRRILVWTVTAIFLITTFLLSSRLIIIGSLILAAIYYFNTYKRLETKSLGYILIIISGGLIIGFAIMNVKSVRARLLDEFLDKYTFAPARGIHYNSLNSRISETICGCDIIINNPIWGVGTGDVQDKLNECYKLKGFSPVLYEKNYNPHNQFLHTFSGLGILGISILFSLIVYLVKSLGVVNNTAYSYVILIICMLFFTETFFGFQKGVVFFSLFIPLLSIKNH